MEVIRNIEDLNSVVTSVVTVGVFDGVHLGHQEIMRTVKNAAEEKSARSVVVTFDRIPEQLVHPSNVVPYITTLPQKLELIEQQGIDMTVVLPLERWVIDMPAEEFVSEILHKKLGAVQVVVGCDFVFGKGRTGNVKLLGQLGESYGFGITTVQPVTIDDTTVSSTIIRKFLAVGNIERANELLGHPFVISGCVVAGEGIGRTLGFPTANVSPPDGQILPGRGVYALSVKIDGDTWIGVANIGTKPTFGGDEIILEVYIIGFSGNIYDRDIELMFRRRLRDEMKFPNIEALKRQIRLDIERASALNV